MAKFKQEWLSGLLGNPKVGILVTDMLRNILYMNDDLSNITGYSEDDLIGQSVKIFYTSEESFEEFGAKVENYIFSREPLSLEFEFIKKNKETHWAYISGYVVESDSVIVWMMVDITDKMKTQSEVCLLKERLEFAFDGSRDIIWDWNLENGNFFVTQNWKDIVGYTQSDVPYTIKAWRKYIHPEDIRHVLKATTKCMNGKNKFIDVTYRLKHNSGSWVWINMRGNIQHSQHSQSMHMIGTQRDVTQEKKLEKKIQEQQEILKYQATFDALTGIPNRYLFNDRLEQAVKKAKRNKTKIALIFIDLDHFKEINDNYGHKAGDEVLKIVSQRLKSILREEDTLSRLGGDEFTIILENINEDSVVKKIAQKVVDILLEDMHYVGINLHISCSLGVSMYPDDSEDADTLLSYADSAMYDAKAKGKNNFQFYKIK